MMMKREVTTARDMKLMSGRSRGRWERGCEVGGGILYCDYYSHCYGVCIYIYTVIGRIGRGERR